MIDFAKLARDVHENSKALGFWEPPHDDLSLKVCLIHSEISKALEELRLPEEERGGPLGAILYACGGADGNGGRVRDDVEHGDWCPRVADFTPARPHTPVGFVSAVADVVIHVLDLTARLGVSLATPVPQQVTLKARPEDVFMGVIYNLGMMHEWAYGLKTCVNPGFRDLVGVQALQLVAAAFAAAAIVGGDLEAAIQIKHAYNLTRPHKHGKEL